MRILVAGILAIGLSATPTWAQTTQTFDACYVPEVGAIYLIGLPGLPTECLSAEHEPISWTEGGAVGDGSVTTAKLADGAVTTAKLAAAAATSAVIADEAVSASKLAPAAVDGTKIADGAVTSGKIASDVPLPPASCATGQIIRWDGTSWICADSPGTSGWEVISHTYSGVVGVAECPAGKVVVGGGFEGATNVYEVSRPIQLSTDQWGWEIGAQTWGTHTVYAICLDRTP